MKKGTCKTLFGAKWSLDNNSHKHLTVTIIRWMKSRATKYRERKKMRKPLNSNQFLISFYRFYYCCDRRINNFLLLHWWQNDEMCHIQTWICFFLHLIFDGKKYDCEKGKRRFVDFIANKQTKKSFNKFANLE